MKYTCEKVCEFISVFRPCSFISQVRSWKALLIKGRAGDPLALVLPARLGVSKGLREHGCPMAAASMVREHLLDSTLATLCA